MLTIKNIGKKKSFLNESTDAKNKINDNMVTIQMSVTTYEKIKELTSLLNEIVIAQTEKKPKPIQQKRDFYDRLTTLSPIETIVEFLYYKGGEGRYKDIKILLDKKHPDHNWNSVRAQIGYYLEKIFIRVPNGTHNPTLKLMDNFSINKYRKRNSYYFTESQSHG